MYRAGIEAVLATEADIKVTVSGKVHEATAQLRHVRPQVVLLGSVRGHDQVLTALGRLRRMGTPPVLLLIPAQERISLHGLLEAGALGITDRDGGAAALAHAVRTVASGGWSLPAQLARTVVTGYLRGGAREHGNRALQEVRERLTPRQQEVLTLMSEGMTNPEIAEVLSVGTATVKDHVQTILDRLGTPNRTLAARLAWEAQLATCGPATPSGV
ncbi:response regulator transcription factor [Streptomyces uncialis]|uniref:response regulator transcription factor n=1 Tax=Streptomyces uncialis TaxID=1048205 RepID=UPI0015B7B3B7|nr:response regulator transcription factor [Streptomyces uncialis]WTE13701.1 response regulator transcription factor [Streptomyces uncialis]